MYTTFQKTQENWAAPKPYQSYHFLWLYYVPCDEITFLIFLVSLIILASKVATATSNKYLPQVPNFCNLSFPAYMYCSLRKF